MRDTIKVYKGFDKDWKCRELCSWCEQNPVGEAMIKEGE